MTGAAALLAAGCADTTGAARSRSQAISAASPKAQAASTSASRASGQETVVAWVPQTGFVQGTRAAVARFGAPLRSAGGINRTVESCRAMVEAEAVKMGAKRVEAVSAGPQHRDAKGQIVGPVRVRILYARPLGYHELREATLTCVTDARGNVVDARV
jgi:hypothetical protein